LATRFSRKRKSHIAAAGLENEARRLLHALGLSEGELHSRKVAQLSIGQQQRVAAARALLGGPRLIIADEPTSSLDADARENFLQLLMRECSACNAAILFVSHDTALSVLFDRTIALNEINLVQQSAFV
jgi:putative ABC transport system ATP-binding protein